MSLLLPAGLPAGFTLEPADSTSVAEVFELVEAEQTAAFGFCPQTEEDVRSTLELPTDTPSTKHLVRRDADRTVAQWWGAFRDPGDPITRAWVGTHPQLPDADADALARIAWAALLDWARAHPPEGVDDIEVHAGSPAGSTTRPRHLAAAGFTRQRTFWEMLGPVTDETRTAPQVPGLVITATRDVAAIHGVLNVAFLGHYEFTPASLADWLSVEETYPGFDPDLRYLATIDDVPAAAMLLSRRVETQDAMYVGDLATLAEFRRRGIASALLAHAFEVAAGEGLGFLSLHVDSESAHDAPAVYRRAGLEVRTAFWAYAKTLVR